MVQDREIQDLVRYSAKHLIVALICFKGTKALRRKGKAQDKMNMNDICLFIYLSSIYLLMYISIYLACVHTLVLSLKQKQIYHTGDGQHPEKQAKKKKKEQICLQLDESIPQQQDDYRGHIEHELNDQQGFPGGSVVNNMPAMQEV